MKKHLTLVPAAVAVLTLSLSSCAGSSADTSVTDASGTASPPSAGTAPDDGAAATTGGFPGASGEVAAVQGDVLQVQSASAGQVAVTLTGSTAITTQVPITFDALTVGSCVVVVGAASDDAGSDSATTVATTVGVSDPVDGECTGGGPAGARGGDRGGDRGERPSGAPSGTPSSGPDGAAGGGGRGGRQGGMVAGEVTALDDGGFTVAAVSVGAPGGAISGDSTADPVETTEVTVTLGADTDFTTTADGSADDIAVGACVSARGEADDTGAITADTVSVSDKVDGECSSVGFGGGPRGAGRDAA